jgi:hypothetical protein
LLAGVIMKHFRLILTMNISFSVPIIKKSHIITEFMSYINGLIHESIVFPYIISKESDLC